MADYGKDSSDDVDPNFDANARPQQGSTFSSTAAVRSHSFRMIMAAAWLSNHQSYEQLSIQFITSDFQNLTASVIYENTQSGASRGHRICIQSHSHLGSAVLTYDTCTVPYPTCQWLG